MAPGPRGQRGAPVAPAPEAMASSAIAHGTHRRAVPCTLWHPLPSAPMQGRTRHGTHCHRLPCTLWHSCKLWHPLPPWHPWPSVRASHPLQAMASVASYGIRCQPWHPLPSAQAMASVETTTPILMCRNAMAPVASHGIHCHLSMASIAIRGIHCQSRHSSHAMASIAIYGTLFACVATYGIRCHR